MSLLQEGRYVIGTVCWKTTMPWYTVSLMNTYRAIGENRFVHPEFFLVQGLYIISARNILVQQVKKMHQIGEVPGILWIDSDMQWEISDVEMILAFADENPEAVIGCLYPGREGEMIAGNVESRDLISPATHLGFGFTWTPFSCFNGPDPWFFNDWRNGNIIGEDVYFCEQQKAAGRKILGIRESNVRHSYEPGPRGLASPGTQIINQDGVRYL